MQELLGSLQRKESEATLVQFTAFLLPKLSLPLVLSVWRFFLFLRFFWFFFFFFFFNIREWGGRCYEKLKKKKCRLISYKTPSNSKNFRFCEVRQEK